MEMATVSEFLDQLSKLQSTGSEVYPAGVFPSLRYHPFLPYSREDDNLFFSATIALTLQNHLDRMGQDEKLKAQGIIDGVTSSISLFANKDGKPTYNFWQTQPSRHFPNGVFMRHLEHFRIPDDADDTALVHLLVDHGRAEHDKLLMLLERHANLGKKQVRNTWFEFKNLKAISTFFGEKMRIEFDAVVICNVLSLLLKHGSESEIVKDSLTYVDGILSKGLHLSDPFYAAPNYPTSELILYHVVRLLYAHPEIDLNKYRPELESQLVSLTSRNLSPLSQVLISNALLMLGSSHQVVIDNHESVINDDHGYFFHAGMLSAFENSLAQRLAINSLFHLRYRCKALNIVMLMEYLILSRGE